jgi:transposase
VATKPVDFRKGAEGLAALVRETMAADPFSGAASGAAVFRKKPQREQVLASLPASPAALSPWRPARARTTGLSEKRKRAFRALSPQQVRMAANPASRAITADNQIASNPSRLAAAESALRKQSVFVGSFPGAGSPSGRKFTRNALRSQTMGST